jgi:hypothetical protein
MPFHSCTVYREDGTLVVEHVRVNVEEMAGGWRGTLSVSHLAEVVAGERYRMVLDDGRAGVFTVRRNTYAGGADRAVSCDGVGGLA